MLEPLLEDQRILPKTIGILSMEEYYKDVSVNNYGLGKVYSPILC